MSSTPSRSLQGLTHRSCAEIDAIFGDDAVAALGQEDSAAIHKRQRTNSNDEKDVGSF